MFWMARVGQVKGGLKCTFRMNSSFFFVEFFYQIRFYGVTEFQDGTFGISEQNGE